MLQTKERQKYRYYKNNFIRAEFEADLLIYHVPLYLNDIGLGQVNHFIVGGKNRPFRLKNEKDDYIFNCVLTLKGGESINNDLLVESVIKALYEGQNRHTNLCDVNIVSKTPLTFSIYQDGKHSLNTNDNYYVNYVITRQNNSNDSYFQLHKQKDKYIWKTILDSSSIDEKIKVIKMKKDGWFRVKEKYLSLLNSNTDEYKSYFDLFIDAINLIYYHKKVDNSC